MSNTNFLQFDVNQQNMLNDTEYNSDAQRISGVSEGIARSQLYNKTLFQSSTMVKALADLMVDGGQNVMDNNLTALKQTIKNSFITAWSDNIFSGDNTFSGSVSLNGTLSASQSVKQTVVGYGEPDYSTAVSVTLPFTATYKGWLLGYASRSGGNSTLYVNNFVVSREDGEYANIQMLLDIGDEVTYTHPTSSGIDLVFVKCKGV